MASIPRDPDDHRRHPSSISQKVLNHRRMRRRQKRNDRRFLSWDITGILQEGQDDDDEEAIAA